MSSYHSKRSNALPDTEPRIPDAQQRAAKRCTVAGCNEQRTSQFGSVCEAHLEQRRAAASAKKQIEREERERQKRERARIYESPEFKALTNARVDLAGLEQKERYALERLATLRPLIKQGLVDVESAQLAFDMRKAQAAE